MLSGRARGARDARDAISLRASLRFLFIAPWNIPSPRHTTPRPAAVSGLRQKTKPASRALSSLRHIQLQVGGLGALALAFLFIVAHKLRAGKQHFTSWHSICALLTALLVLGVGGLGGVLKFRPALAGGAMRARRRFPLHRFLGYLGALGALATLLLAMFTHWAERHLAPGLRVVVCLLVSGAGIVLIAGADRSSLAARRTSLPLGSRPGRAPSAAALPLVA
jgi:hypothetical protein